MRAMSCFGMMKNHYRVVLSLGLLISSKLITIQVPFLFKSIVDQLSVSQEVGWATGGRKLHDWQPKLANARNARFILPGPKQLIAADPTTTIPLALLLGYGIARTTATAFQELRNSVFATVAQKAIRKVRGRTTTRTGQSCPLSTENEHERFFFFHLPLHRWPGRSLSTSTSSSSTSTSTGARGR